MDRAARRGDRASRACAGSGLSGGRVDRVRRERAPRAGQRAARRLRARPAPRPPGACRRRASRLGPIGARRRRVLRARCRLHPARAAGRGRTPRRPGRRGGARHPRAAAAGLPRPQSRAAVERPRRSCRCTGPPARHPRAGRGLAAAGAGRRAPDRPGGPLGRGDREPAAARALLAPASASSPAVANALARLYLLDEEAEAARATLAAHLDALDARHGASLPTRAEAACSTRSPWTPSPSTRPPRSRWNALSTWPSRQGYAGCSWRTAARSAHSCAATSATAPPIPRWSATSWRRSSAAGARPTVAAARLWPSC